ncbi:MAG: helix-turn-helix domain-containing protein [Azonexus sp.]
MNAIQKSCEIVGSQKALADFVGVTPGAVNQWMSGLRPVPVERCPAIELSTSGQVTRRDLRPDDWHLIWPELVTDEFPVPVSSKAA